MFSTIFTAILAFWVALLPIYLWGYGVSYLLDAPWNRRRFIIGMILGGFSVGLVAWISQLELRAAILAVVSFFVSMSVILTLMFWYGTSIGRPLMSRMAITNISILIVLCIGVLLFSQMGDISGRVIILATFPLLLASFFEESSKHLMSLGLMSQDFRFSRRDIIIFTLFIVLGFVFVENLLYLWIGHWSMLTWVFRSSLTLMAHLLSSSIVAIGWWAALSYPPFSFGYISRFLLGFSLAALVHMGYNIILEQQSIVGLIAYVVFGYIIITQGILRK